MTAIGEERPRTPRGEGPAARRRTTRAVTEGHLLREAHGMALAMDRVFRCAAQLVTGQGREGEPG